MTKFKAEDVAEILYQAADVMVTAEWSEFDASWGIEQFKKLPKSSPPQDA